MPKPNCTEELFEETIEFGRLGRRVVEGRFDGGSMTSDGGVMLLGATDRKLGLIAAAARCIADPRSPLLIKHAVRDMLRQRIYGLALGWEDLNDHGALRLDVAMQTAVGVDREVASAPTLCRLENWADRATAWRLHEVLVDQFIASFKTAPEELVLDFDATDNPLYGRQEQRFFHGYYDSYCYLPLYVFCGQQLLCAYLRPSHIDGAQHAAAILKLLVTRLRQSWPDVRIVFRGDSGFCRKRIINWCERSGVHYIVGLARNARLEARVEYAEAMLQDQYEKSRTKQRLVGEFSYAAQSWPHERRVITRLEWGERGCNPRFVVTNLAGEPQALYDDLYCQRGEAENRIKEAQIGLFATRTSCQYLRTNQLRVLLAALGYVLIERLRALALQGTALATAQVDTLRIGVGAWMPPPPGRMTAPFKERQRGTLMPYKHNTKGRHHIPKMLHAVTNWPQYEAGLRRRGCLTLWITQEAIEAWAATRRSTPGGQAVYSDSAIQTCLMLRAAFKLALRQAEGLMLSVVELLRCELAVPDHTTVSRRAARLESITRGPLPRGPLHVLIDSTGLKVFGAGQWLSEKHMHSRRKWRKLHLAVDAGSGQIVAVTLTEQDLSDESQVGPLLAQIQSPIQQLTADGAYDGEPTYRTIAAHADSIEVVIPPRHDAVPSAGFETDPSPRDTHLFMISSLGRLRWQEITGYGQRALVETAMGRYKALIGERLRCRGDATRRTEAVVGVAVLNCMLGAARPNSVRRSVIQA